MFSNSTRDCACLEKALVCCYIVAAICTGLTLIDSTLGQWLIKVMGGFVGWEAVFYILLEVHLKWKIKRTGKYTF